TPPGAEGGRKGSGRNMSIVFFFIKKKKKNQIKGKGTPLP
ncbi:hypothetical protein HMPREF9541_00913, partial [Escherichia coli MS 116-1]